MALGMARDAEPKKKKPHADTRLLHYESSPLDDPCMLRLAEMPWPVVGAMLQNEPGQAKALKLGREGPPPRKVVESRREAWNGGIHDDDDDDDDDNNIAWLIPPR